MYFEELDSDEEWLESKHTPMGIEEFCKLLDTMLKEKTASKQSPEATEDGEKSKRKRALVVLDKEPPKDSINSAIPEKVIIDLAAYDEEAATAFYDSHLWCEHQFCKNSSYKKACCLVIVKTELL